MTATPIPRTLQFSLMGSRDLSVISTPPPNRQPIATESHLFDEEIIREAIGYELSRNGQVYFVHNRVETIGNIERLVRKLCPEARVGVGHGQMNPQQLEQLMMDFIYGEFDVLVATSIIESGVDVPNANTIIIDNAQNFGLSDLHQLRGRVGRSNRKAFCYLLTPPDEMLSSDARRRLRAIEEFSDLGAGFNIAMQDLDIRGAGNLLGGEQSGFIADIGFETYQKILNEAIAELREEEFAKTGETPGETAPPQPATYISADRHRPRSLYPGRLHQQFRRENPPVPRTRPHHRRPAAGPFREKSDRPFRPGSGSDPRVVRHRSDAVGMHRTRVRESDRQKRDHDPEIHRKPAFGLLQKHGIRQHPENRDAPRQ